MPLIPEHSPNYTYTLITTQAHSPRYDNSITTISYRKYTSTSTCVNPINLFFTNGNGMNKAIYHTYIDHLYSTVKNLHICIALDAVNHADSGNTPLYDWRDGGKDIVKVALSEFLKEPFNEGFMGAEKLGFTEGFLGAGKSGFTEGFLGAGKSGLNSIGSAILSAVSSIASDPVEGTKSAVEGAKSAVEGAVGSIADSKAVEGAKGAVEGALGSIADSKAVEDAKGAIEGALGSIADSKAVEGAKTTLEGAAGSITDSKAGVSSAVSNTVDGVKDAIPQSVSNTANNVSTTVSGVVDNVSTSLSGAIPTSVSDTVSSVSNTVSSAIKGVFSAETASEVKNDIASVRDSAKNAAENSVNKAEQVKDSISSTTESIKTGAQASFEKAEEVKDKVVSVGESAKSGVTNSIDKTAKIKNSVSQSVQSTEQSIKTFSEKVAETASDAKISAQTAAENASKAANTASNTISDILSNTVKFTTNALERASTLTSNAVEKASELTGINSVEDVRNKSSKLVKNVIDTAADIQDGVSNGSVAVQNSDTTIRASDFSGGLTNNELIVNTVANKASEVRDDVIKRVTEVKEDAAASSTFSRILDVGNATLDVAKEIAGTVSNLSGFGGTGTDIDSQEKITREAIDRASEIKNEVNVKVNDIQNKANDLNATAIEKASAVKEDAFVKFGDTKNSANELKTEAVNRITQSRNDVENKVADVTDNVKSVTDSAINTLLKVGSATKSVFQEVVNTASNLTGFGGSGTDLESQERITREAIDQVSHVRDQIAEKTDEVGSKASDLSKSVGEKVSEYTGIDSSDIQKHATNVTEQASSLKEGIATTLSELPSQAQVAATTLKETSESAYAKAKDVALSVAEKVSNKNSKSKSEGKGFEGYVFGEADLMKLRSRGLVSLPKKSSDKSSDSESVSDSKLKQPRFGGAPKVREAGDSESVGYDKYVLSKEDKDRLKSRGFGSRGSKLSSIPAEIVSKITNITSNVSGQSINIAIGHSMSGFKSIYACLREPTLFDSLVLINPVAYTDDDHEEVFNAKLKNWIDAEYIKSEFDITSNDWLKEITKFFSEKSFFKRFDPIILHNMLYDEYAGVYDPEKKYKHVSLKTSRAAQIVTYAACHPSVKEVLPAYKYMSIPTYHIVAENDTVTHTACQYIRNEMKDVIHPIDVPGTYHCINGESPKILAPILETTINEIVKNHKEKDTRALDAKSKLELQEKYVESVLKFPVKGKL